jgi:hypothetical protein
VSLRPEDRRASMRIPCEISAELQIVLSDESNSRVYPVRVVDISTLGAGVALDRTVAPEILKALGESRLARLRIKRDPRRFHIYSKVVWVDEKINHIGLWFTSENKGLDEDLDFQSLISQMT